MTGLPDTSVIHQIRSLAAGETVPDRADLRAALEARELAYECSAGSLRLLASLELLDEAGLSAALPFPVAVLFAVDSTNSHLMQTVRAGDSPRAVLAEQQTGGRGRRGRTWVSPFGRNLYLSYAFSFPGEAAALSGLSIAVGIVVASVLRAEGLHQVGLKWPNDVLTPEGKLAGILVEVGAGKGGLVPVVIGVGINMAIDATQAKSIDQPWTAVSHYIDAGRNLLATQILGGLHEMTKLFCHHGLKELAEQWQVFDHYAGEPVTITTGQEQRDGIARGISNSGHLRLATAQGEELIEAGEVSLRKRQR